MLQLRRAGEDDFSFYYKLKCESSSVYWSGFTREPDKESLYQFWNSVIVNGDGNREIYILYSDNNPVGYVQIADEDNKLELSMGILADYRGKGFGTEIIRLAILQYTNKDYFSYVREDDYASQRCFENNGFYKTEDSYEQYFALDRSKHKMIKYKLDKHHLLANVPARSGSKGLKDKNIRPLNGKPLLAYSVEAAIGSGLFDTVHVSTDSQEYANIARSYGADESFLRDEQNSGDAASSWDAVREVLRKYKEIGKEYDICVLLQPTSPMRTAKDIKEAYELFVEKKAVSLTSVTEVDHPVQWCFTLDAAGSMKNFAISPYQDSRRQELEKHYRENGAIYIVGTKDVTDPDFDFYTEQCVAYVMDRGRSIDVDTLQDFVVAETIMKLQAEETL